MMKSAYSAKASRLGSIRQVVMNPRTPRWILPACLALVMAPEVSLLGQSATVDPAVLEHINAGLQARRENRLEDEAREFEAVARLAPNLAEAHLNLGLARHKQGRLREAVESFEAALRLKPDLGGVPKYLGIDSLRIGRLRQAINSLENARESQPADALVSAWLGAGYFQAGRHREAIPLLEEALKTRPDDYNALFYLAKAYQALGDSLSDHLFHRAPHSARARQAAAENYAAVGRREDALREYGRALEQDAALAGIHAAVAKLYVEDGKLAEAEAAYQAELTIQPESSNVNFAYGGLLIRLGRSEAAVPYLETAVRLEPGLVPAYYQIGLGLLENGHLAEAGRVFLRTTQIDVPIELQMSSHEKLTRIYKKLGSKKKAHEQVRILKQLRKQIAAQE